MLRTEESTNENVSSKQVAQCLQYHECEYVQIQIMHSENETTASSLQFLYNLYQEHDVVVKVVF